jgi:hypothetical protein
MRHKNNPVLRSESLAAVIRRFVAMRGVPVLHK